MTEREMSMRVPTSGSRSAILVLLCSIIFGICCGAGDKAISREGALDQYGIKSVPEDPTTSLDPDLQVQLDKWNKQSIKNYDMVIECICGTGIGGPAASVAIKVRDSETRSIVSTREADTRETKSYERISTVEKMFEFIQHIRSRGEQNANNSNTSYKGFPKVSTTFDDKYGLPNSINIGWSLDTDAFSRYTVKEFVPVVNR